MNKFKIEDLAPLGFEMMEKSLNPLQYEDYIQRIKNFEIEKDDILKTEFKDFTEPDRVSFPLTKESVDFNDSLSFALIHRKSVRHFKKSVCDFAKLSQILRLSAGIKPGSFEQPLIHRFYPSGGGLFTTRIYVDIRNVENIPIGLYHYNPLDDCLDFISNQIQNSEWFKLHNGSQDTETIQNSNFEIIISSKPAPALLKYGEHGWKLILMEIGHLTQNLWLMCVTHGLSGYPCTSINQKIAKSIFKESTSNELFLESLIIGLENISDS